MFGQTNPFGQTNNTSSPFGSQPVFGQTNSASNNPFAPKPFGSTSPFGSQPGTSLFGGTSTGVFGQPSAPMNSTTTFGASSSQPFGSPTPAFGASSTPAFGSSSPAFGGSSVFGQNPAFGGFGSTPTQASPFGNSFQQSQPAFGSSMFGSSSPFGASSQPAFGASSTPAFGAASSPAFGVSSSPAFGSTASPAFGSTGSAFGASNTSVFGSGGAFGAPSTPFFGSSSTNAFGASSAPSPNFGSTPAFGQSASAFGSSPFGSSTTPFGAQSSPFGSQSTTPAFGNTGFGQSAFGGQRGGSRVATYTPTTETDSNNAPTSGRLMSISAMPVHNDKNHEELRWADYQLGDKGGPPPAGQSATGIGFNTSAPQSTPFNSSPSFAQTSSNLFSSSTSSNPFAPKTSTFVGTGFGSSSAFTSPSPFGSSIPNNPFGAASSATPSLFQTSASAVNPFGSSSTPSLFNTSSSPAFGSSPSIFGSAPAQATTSAFNAGFGNTQSSGLFQSSPSFGQTGSAFGQNITGFGQNSAPSFSQTNIFNTPSTGFGGMFSSSPSLISSSNQLGFGQTNPSFATPFPLPTPAQATNSFGFNNFGQTQAAGSSGFGLGGSSSIFAQNNFGQQTATPSPAVLQPVLVTNPFGTLPAMPHISIGRAGNAPSVQYGISCMPVVDKPAPARISSLLTSRHLSQRRVGLSARKYHPKNDGPKVPFFSDDEEAPSTPKVDALFIPRENPRSLVIHPSEQWPTKTSMFNDSSTTTHENGKISEETIAPHRNRLSAEDKGKNLADEDGIHKERNQNHAKGNAKPNGLHNDQEGSSHTTLSGEASVVYEQVTEALMPKLRGSDYYTEPNVQQLVARERSDPGHCRRVKDFTVGRHGYGSIRFIGETDVRRLDLESLVQFNNREVIVYMDDTKKPPVGQGLNKPAEVTLLNIKCVDKKTGKRYEEGPKVEKYKEMLKRKVEEQGGSFVSYDPVGGVWRFRVEHFSKYGVEDDDDLSFR